MNTPKINWYFIFSSIALILFYIAGIDIFNKNTSLVTALKALGGVVIVLMMLEARSIRKNIATEE